uniref:Uncharacterized protein n=1 Tax=Romanomermis culicivorax TaxID=13658 RepID=A0A915J177_ROMCU
MYEYQEIKSDNVSTNRSTDYKKLECAHVPFVAVHILEMVPLFKSNFRILLYNDFGKNTMNEIMHAVTEHCRRFPKAFQMSRLACCLSVALFSIFGFFVCLQRYYPILIIDRKYWTNTASAASIFPTTTNKLINKIGETNKGANGHRRDHVAPLIPNYRIDLVYYSENNSTIVYAFVASLWSCLTLFFAFLLSLANDMAYEWRIFHRRRKSHECMAILSLVSMFLFIQ